MLSVIRSGLAAATQEISVVSNNIANAGTNGFKRSTALFEDIYADAMPDAAMGGLGLGAQPIEPRRSHAQGSVATSGQVLDMAVLGAGMFVLEPRPGDAAPSYTRNGAARIDSAGRIVTAGGQAFLTPAGTPITVPAALAFEDGRRSLLTSLTIEKNGEVRAIYGDSGQRLLGQLALARFPNEAGLRATGDALFVDDAAAGEARIAPAGTPGFGVIQAGALERSNTDLTAELVNLIRAQQTFGSNAKAMQTSMDMDRRLIG